VTGPAVDRDAGLSVVETSVAMVVAALLLAAVTGVYIGVLRTVHSVDVSTSSVADARLGIEAMSRTLRVALRPEGADAAFTAASRTGVSFWALLNRTDAPSVAEPAPTLVVYGYDGTCVTEAQTRDGLTRRTCLVRTDRPPTFTYYGSAALAADGSGVSPLAADPDVPTTDLAQIRSVEVSLGVQSPTDAGQPPVTVVNRVTLANLAQVGS
jgi:hypothetical protein